MVAAARASELSLIEAFVVAGRVIRCPTQREIAIAGANLPQAPFTDALQAAAWLNAQGGQTLSPKRGLRTVFHLSIGHGKYRCVTARVVLEQANRLRAERLKMRAA